MGLDWPPPRATPSKAPAGPLCRHLWPGLRALRGEAEQVWRPPLPRNCTGLCRTPRMPPGRCTEPTNSRKPSPLLRRGTSRGLWHAVSVVHQTQRPPGLQSQLRTLRILGPHGLLCTWTSVYWPLKWAPEKSHTTSKQPVLTAHLRAEHLLYSMGSSGHRRSPLFPPPRASDWRVVKREL